MRKSDNLYYQQPAEPYFPKPSEHRKAEQKIPVTLLRNEGLIERDTVDLDHSEWGEREGSQEETQNTCLRQNMSMLSKIEYEEYMALYVAIQESDRNEVR